jgi:hypothetical protein
VITFARRKQQGIHGARNVQVASDHEPIRPATVISGLDVAGPIAPERALATGVLHQAAADLRRFRDSKDAVGREVYFDARSWFMSNDREWPYSFTNVCDSLGLSPDDMRDEVFADEHSGWLLHSGRVARATAKQFVGSFSALFSSRRRRALEVRHL